MSKKFKWLVAVSSVIVAVCVGLCIYFLIPPEKEDVGEFDIYVETKISVGEETEIIWTAEVGGIVDFSVQDVEIADVIFRDFKCLLKGKAAGKTVLTAKMTTNEKEETKNIEIEVVGEEKDEESFDNIDLKVVGGRLEGEKIYSSGTKFSISVKPGENATQNLKLQVAGSEGLTVVQLPGNSYRITLSGDKEEYLLYITYGDKTFIYTVFLESSQG